MEIEEIEDDLYLSMYYVYRYTKHLNNNNDLYVVCIIHGTEDNKQWERYQLKCGHIMHTRCFRHWMCKQKHLNCPYCCDIPETHKNCYFGSCETFGHPTTKHNFPKYENSDNDEIYWIKQSL